MFSPDVQKHLNIKFKDIEDMLFQFYYGGYGNIGATLQRFGIFDIFIPFMLVFAIVYATLKKVDIFSGQENVRKTIAAAIGLTFVAPHIGGTQSYYYMWFGMDPVAVINSAIPQVGVILVALTLALIAAGLGGWEVSTIKEKNIIGWICFGLVVFIFLYGLGFFQNFVARYLWFLLDPGLLMLVMIILVFGLLISWIGSEGSGGSGGGSSGG